MTHFGSNQQLYPTHQQPAVSPTRIYATAAIGVLALATVGVAAPIVVWCSKHKLITSIILKAVL